MPKAESIILDLGWGNLHALQQFFVKMGYQSRILPPDIVRNIRLKKNLLCIIPGIGSASQFSNVSQTQRLAVTDIIEKADFTIGICLGAHFLTKKTEECDGVGLGLIETNVLKINGKFEIGYRKVRFQKNEYMIYHCHNYYIPENNNSVSIDILGNGIHYSQITSANNICLIQGHPEKSGSSGEMLIKDILKKKCI